MAAIVRRRATTRSAIEPMFDAFRDALAERVRRTAARRRRGEHPGAHPRHAADGAVQQARLDRAHHRQQVARWRSATRRSTATWRAASAVLKDISKTLVYRLCAYRNELGRVIPERIITRAPSAELRPDQVDQDSLPPYDALDGDPRSLRRAGQEPGRDRGAGLSRRSTCARVVRLIKVQRVQAAAGGGGHPHHAARLRPATGAIRSRRRGTSGRPRQCASARGVAAAAARTHRVSYSRSRAPPAPR